MGQDPVECCRSGANEEVKKRGRGLLPVAEDADMQVVSVLLCWGRIPLPRALMSSCHLLAVSSGPICPGL